MNIDFKDINEMIQRHPDVISAKVPEWLFQAVEIFREEYGLKCRNATIIVLLTLGLRKCEIIDLVKCNEVLNEQGCIQIQEGVKE